MAVVVNRPRRATYELLIFVEEALPCTAHHYATLAAASPDCRMDAERASLFVDRWRLPQFRRGRKSMHVATRIGEERLIRRSFAERSDVVDFVRKSSRAHILAGVDLLGDSVEDLVLLRPFLRFSGVQLLIRSEREVVEWNRTVMEALSTFTTIMSLDFSKNVIRADGAEKISAAIGGWTLLQHLDVSFSFLGSDGMIALSRVLGHFRELRSLAAGGNRLDEQCAADIRRALLHTTQLEVLDLASNAFRGEDIDALLGATLQLSHLRQLILSDNPLGGEGGKRLGVVVSKLSVLEVLDLSRTNMSDEGGAAVCVALPGRPMRTLSLSVNRLGSGTTAAMIAAMDKLTTLEEIFVARSGITGDDRARLEKAKPHRLHLEW